MALFNFNKAPAALFETHARVRETDEEEPIRIEFVPSAPEKTRALQEARAGRIALSATPRRIRFSPLVSSERSGLPARAGLMGNAGVVLFLSGLLTAFATGVALLFGVSGLGPIVATAAIVAAVGAVLVGGDGGR